MSAAASCQNCGTAAATVPLFSRADVARCDRCGGWSYTGPVEQSAEALYGEAYFNGGEYTAYAAAEQSHVRNFRRKLELLARFGLERLEDVRMLELGCATGVFMEVARAAGVRSMLGIEPSAYGRAAAARRGCTAVSPLDPAAGRLVSELRPNLVVAWDVWEHLPSPASTIDDVLGKADPCVIVALTTVDAGSAVARLRGAKWRQFHPPTHLHYPTRRSLRAYAASRGLRIAHHTSFGYYRPLFEYLSAVGMRPRARGKIASWPVYLNLFDIQLLIARRGA